MSNTEKKESVFTVSDWLGCILVLVLIFTLLVWPFAILSITEMYDDFGGTLPTFTYLFVKAKLSSFLGLFTLVFFSMQFTGWVSSSIRRRRLWVVSSFIMSLIAMGLCIYALHLPVFQMASSVGD